MSTGREDNEEATMRGIPAFTLQPHAKTGRMAWVSCTVLKYAEERKVYKALVDGRATAVEVPRVYLMFAAEDPRNFAKRVAAAHKYRADTEAAVMYTLTVDCIPAHGHGVEVSQKRIEEIFRKSSNGTSFKLDSQVAQRLVAEINLIHSRSLNKMILDAAIEADPDAFPGVVVPKAEPKPRGWHRHDEKSRPLESFSFDAKVAMIQKKIMHNHIDVLAAIDAVRATCEPIEAPSMSLFATKLVKSVTLEEFQTMQSQASESVKNFISNAWVPDVQKAVVESIGNYGKGWFNMQEQSLEIYEVSKLKQFMRLTRLIMQDALRTITLNSCHQLAELVDKASERVKNAPSLEWPVDEGFHSEVFKPPTSSPLWSVDLIVDTEKNELTFSTPVQPFEEAIIALFDNGIQSTAGVLDVEPRLMPHLFWVGVPTIDAVSLLEPWVQKLREGIRHNIKLSTTPLLAYKAIFEKYKDLIELDIDQYIATFTAEPKDANAIRNECMMHLKSRDKIEKELPLTVDIGLFCVHVHPVRTWLLEKRKKLAHAILDFLGKRLRASADEVCKEYTEISARLHQKPNGVEELAETRDYMSTLPDVLKSLSTRGSKAISEWELLADFQCNMSDDDSMVLWSTFGWPKKVQQLKIETVDNHNADEDRFRDNLVGDVAAFDEHITLLKKQVYGFFNNTDIKQVESTAVEARKIQKALETAQKNAETYRARQGLFRMEQTEYDVLKRTIKEFTPFKDLWITADVWTKKHHFIMTDSFVSLDPIELDAHVQLSSKTITKCLKSFKDIPGCRKVAEEVKQWITEFLPFAPLIQALRNPGMRERHWEQVSEKLGFEFKMDDKLTFTKCLELRLQDHVESIVKVGEFAAKEFQIETALDDMAKQWEPIDLEMRPYKQTGTFILAAAEDAMQMLDDHIVMTQAMSFSPYKKPFEARIAAWEQKLLTSSDVIEEWLKVQQSWLYLEPIFSSDDIAQQLPTENKRYQTMDRIWRKAMANCWRIRNVINACPSIALLEDMRECNKLLDQVQKGLSAYLETKRGSFPRFYFLSDDELLEILSQTKDPTAVQPHMRKCFDNIAKLRFDPEPQPGVLISSSELSMTHFIAGDGEAVAFNELVRPKGNVEDWLLEVERVMQRSLREIFQNAWAEYVKMDRVEWVTTGGWPGMIVIAGCQTAWTIETGLAIENDDLVAHSVKCDSQLAGLVLAIRGKLDKITRKVVSALIVIEVHAKDVIHEMVEDGIKRVSDFEWIKQLRYYWEEDDEGEENIAVKAVTAVFNYGYEYLGNSGRLVITPLTDRCYLTLTGALSLIYGGAPAGPAGTGKTETTKDLAKALAIQCVVFNCSDQLDYLAMAKFFKGLASSGAWACFDEFNRIDIEVLSVVAQQVATIQLAIKAKEKRFMFEGVDLQLKWTCAPFITMNPGYAGRTELPDNLAALFRPVAMMVPDYSMIAEIFLYSFGFENAKPLSKKVTTVFKLSSEQLSSQDHYDFGMRAVKTVITAAGNLKRAFGDDMAEDQIVLRAIRDVNVPKFLAQDLVLFDGIVSDLFPDTKIKEIDYSAFKKSILAGCEKHNLQGVDNFVRKVIELYETTVVRHGLMLVGPTCSGKTRCREVLSTALTSLGAAGELDQDGAVHTKVNNYVLNPKSITMGQLYGQFDPLTHEWTDGILSTLIRLGVAAQNMEKKWFVFDGPVDAIWIENMNTVLDDNKKLCLASGEIIALTDPMRMIFEVEDLTVASPATVSRCGMVYLEPALLGLDPFVKSWLDNELPEVVEPQREAFQKLFDNYLDEAVEFVRLNLKEMNRSVDGNLCFSLLKLLDCFLEPFQEVEGREVKKDRIEAIPDLVEPWFLFSVVWSIGATCDSDGRVKFDKWFREKMAANGVTMRFPEEGTVYDYRMVDDGSRKEANEDDDDADDDDGDIQIAWQRWTDGVDAPEINPKAEFSSIIISTLDTLRTEYILEKLMTNQKQVVVIGPTGTGKTLNVQNKLLRGMPKKYMSTFINFSAQTSANQTQDMIDAKLDKRRKGIYAPPLGKQYVIFIDDLNMPALEEYGAQPPIEIIRQWMDHEGWYDRKAIGSFMQLIDITFAAAMGPPGGGRNQISDRLMRHFNMLTMTELSDESRTTIFTPILQAFLGQVPSALKDTTVSNLIGETISLFTKVIINLLPTPAKVHYTFNLRDLAKVFQGMLMTNVKTIVEEVDVVRSWVHECNRVFRDRLINDEDRTFFDIEMKDKCTKVFGYEWGQVENMQPLIYGDFMDVNQDPRLYEQFPELPKVKEVMDEALQDYNEINTAAKMNLVLFEDAIMHCCRVSRVIRQPLGNALLLGVGGSGRQSMTRLAAHLADFKCFQIELAKNYGMTEWREDLKRLMQGAGMTNEPVVFLFSDTQIKSESFLEDINNILNSGDVPGIYDSPEMDAIYAAMKPIVQGAGLPVTKANMFAMYCGRVRANVHSVICMSPIGEVFRQRLRQFPALVSCCTIDWFSPWPVEALTSVAQTLLADIPTLPDQEIIGKVVKMCGSIHQSVIEKSGQFESELGRVNYVTPTAYLSLIEIFVKMIGDKQKSLKDARDKTATGMLKLQATEEEVEQLQEELTAMQPMLKEASKETAEAMVEISKNKAIAEETAISVGETEAAATKEASATKQIADDAQRDLDEALPALDQAVASLKSLKKDDITEVKNFSDPPGGVKMVMEGVCIMFGVKPKMVPGEKPGQKIADYWAVTGPLLVAPAKFLDSLFQFDKENIPESCIKKIRPYIENPAFTPAAISKVSRACTAICSWVRAMYKYHNVAKMVEPKRKALAEANASLQITMKKLATAKAQLKEVTDSIESMEIKFEAMTSKKQQLEDKAKECTAKLERAERLIKGLGGEKVRWAKSIKMGDELLANVVGDIVVSAGTVAYLGPFTEEYRADLRNTWCTRMKEIELPHTDAASLVSTLSDAVEVRDWQLHGLPKDSMATENACVVKYSERWPLFIDPQSQANRWIKMKEGDKLVVMKLTDRDFLRSLENAVRFGSQCLLENVAEELDPALEPILLRQTYKSPGGLVIKLGDSVIPYHEDFAFYITTKLPNPLYTPEVSTKVTVINFILSPSGLEDQMLGLVVAKERPDLEEAKNELIVNNAKMKAELKGLEDLILKLLSECEGSPVDDIDLIEALDQSKIKSDEINAKVAEAEITEKNIDVIRMKYIPVAVRSQLLFFCVTSLARVDPMYQYSLEWFRSIFLQSLEKSDACEELEERIDIINDHFTFSLYSNVCRSLFERHKLLFSFLMCARILMNRAQIDMKEWKFLIVGGTTIPEVIENPDPDWVSDRMWMDLSMLPILPTFVTFAKEFAEDAAAWKGIFDSAAPHREKFPGKWEEALDTFQKLLVIKCLRYDKLPDMMQDFVSNRIGQRFIEPQTANLSQVFPDTNPQTPLIFVLSNGTDPAADLLTFAEEMKFTKKLTSISLGQGQGPKAENMFRMGVERGTWVFFQNCHLSPSWMPTLERLIEQIDPGKVHRDFRLWLTSMPSPKFPVPVLQNGSKMTVEPPRGIKANLLGAFDPLNDEYLNQCSKTDNWKALLLSLCMFHGVLLERRKFGPLGFNIPYGYTQSDLAICMTQLNMFLEDYEDPPYKVLVYTAGHINYGGRVTDDWDRRLQLTLLAGFYNEAVPKEGFKFSPSGVYTQPGPTDYEGYLEYIRDKPINDNPEMFGLHDNANITYANNETDQLLQAILSAGGSGGGGGGGGSNRDSILADLAKDILEKVRLPFDIRAIMKKYPVMYEESMNTVLIQEAIRFNKLLTKVHASLKELQKALKGLVVMSEQLEKASNALFNNSVPDMWQKVAYPSLKPLAAWVLDLVARVDFITKWYHDGIPPMFWISGFYFPQAFLTGSLQNYARQHKVSIDTLSFGFDVLNRSPESIKVKPKDGCYIYGLFLEGARWDAKEGMLLESRAKELFTPMAPFLLRPEVNRPKPKTGIYDCPCYKTLKRAGLLSTTGHSTNFVLPLEVPSNKDQDHWIKRGVGLFCALNY